MKTSKIEHAIDAFFNLTFSSELVKEASLQSPCYLCQRVIYSENDFTIVDRFSQSEDTKFRYLYYKARLLAVRKNFSVVHPQDCHLVSLFKHKDKMTRTTRENYKKAIAITEAYLHPFQPPSSLPINTTITRYCYITNNTLPTL